MEYNKPLMPITELVNLGYSREVLNDWVHIKDFPARRTSPRGKWLIETAKLEKWMIKHKLKRDSA